MRMTTVNLGCLTQALWFFYSTPGNAENFEYEVGISYDATRITNVTNFPGVGLLPPISPIILISDTDYDDVAIFGTWYFDGVEASTGPRSRAAFIGRASAFSASYTNSSGDVKFMLDSSDPAVPSSVDTSRQSANSFSTALRWVWPENGWYGLASLSAVDIDFGSTDISGSSYSLGIGKYIGSQTALDISVVRLDADASGFVVGGDSTSTEAAIAFTHIGSLGPTWQYGTDVALATTDVGRSSGSYDVRLSMYPSRALAFGIEINGALQDPGEAPTEFEVFASWFPRERIEVAANYGRVSIDEPITTDFDQYSFGVGINIRF